MTMTATAAPSLEKYRTAHKIQPKLVSGGIQVCATDDVRIWASAGFRWRHDQATLQRLYQEDIARLIVEPCFFCHRTDMVAVGCYSRVTLGTGVVNLCDNCREKGTESDG